MHVRLARTAHDIADLHAHLFPGLALVHRAQDHADGAHLSRPREPDLSSGARKPHRRGAGHLVHVSVDRFARLLLDQTKLARRFVTPRDDAAGRVDAMHECRYALVLKGLSGHASDVFVVAPPARVMLEGSTDRQHRDPLVDLLRIKGELRRGKPPEPERPRRGLPAPNRRREQSSASRVERERLTSDRVSSKLSRLSFHAARLLARFRSISASNSAVASASRSSSLCSAIR